MHSIVAMCLEVIMLQVTRRTLASYCEGNVIDRATAPADLLVDLDLVVDGPYYDSRGLPDPRPGGFGTIAAAPKPGEVCDVRLKKRTLSC